MNEVESKALTLTQEGQQPEQRKFHNKGGGLKGLAAAGNEPPRYIRSHANTAAGMQKLRLSHCTDKRARWGVTTVISSGIYCYENVLPGVLRSYKIPKMAQPATVSNIQVSLWFL